MLHFSYKTTKICTIANICNTDLQTILNTQFVGMFMIYSQLSNIQSDGGRKVTDNPKPVKTTAEKNHGTKWV
jgi:hypothetical protein